MQNPFVVVPFVIVSDLVVEIVQFFIMSRYAVLAKRKEDCHDRSKSTSA